jgi:putative phosphoesterase
VIRIGVIADTHCPEFMAELPPSVYERLRGVDLIVHAGDIGGTQTLAQLAAIAPVEAVRGDHDPGLRQLPRRRVLEVGGRRIGIVHGNRSRFIEEPVTLLATLTLGRFWPRLGIERWARGQFPDADVIIYGHTHAARADEVDGALVVNPGAVYQVTRSEARRRLEAGPTWFEWCWLQVIRHRLDQPVRSVGIVEIGDEVRARILRLS